MSVILKILIMCKIIHVKNLDYAEDIACKIQALRHTKRGSVQGLRRHYFLARPCNDC